MIRVSDNKIESIWESIRCKKVYKHEKQWMVKILKNYERLTSLFSFKNTFSSKAIVLILEVIQSLNLTSESVYYHITSIWSKK